MKKKRDERKIAVEIREITIADLSAIVIWIGLTSPWRPLGRESAAVVKGLRAGYEAVEEVVRDLSGVYKIRQLAATDCRGRRGFRLVGASLASDAVQKALARLHLQPEVILHVIRPAPVSCPLTILTQLGMLRGFRPLQAAEVASLESEWTSFRAAVFVEDILSYHELPTPFVSKDSSRRLSIAALPSEFSAFGVDLVVRETGPAVAVKPRTA